MTRLPIMFLFCTALGCHVTAAVPEDFLSHLEKTEQMLTDIPVYQQLKKLSELSPERASYVAKFWRQRAILAIGGDLNRLFETNQKLRDSIHAKMIEDEDHKNADRLLKEQTELLFISYYHDHIDQIDAMIRLNLKKANSEKK